MGVPEDKLLWVECSVLDVRIEQLTGSVNGPKKEWDDLKAAVQQLWAEIARINTEHAHEIAELRAAHAREMVELRATQAQQVAELIQFKQQFLAHRCGADRPCERCGGR
jgi:chromosome segregation ATPase